MEDVLRLPRGNGPYPWEILLGRHGYGMTPEMETGWSRVFVLYSLLFGALCGFSCADKINQSQQARICASLKASP